MGAPRARRSHQSSLARSERRHRRHGDCWCRCWRRTACEPAEQIAEDATTTLGRDRQMDTVEMDEQPEQVQVERAEHQIEDLADLARRLLEGRCDLHLETSEALIEAVRAPCPSHAVRRSIEPGR